MWFFVSSVVILQDRSNVHTADVPREEGWCSSLRMETPMGALGSCADLLKAPSRSDRGKNRSCKASAKRKVGISKEIASSGSASFYCGLACRFLVIHGVRKQGIDSIVAITSIFNLQSLYPSLCSSIPFSSKFLRIDSEKHPRCLLH